MATTETTINWIMQFLDEPAVAKQSSGNKIIHAVNIITLGHKNSHIKCNYMKIQYHNYKSEKLILV